MSTELKTINETHPFVILLEQGIRPISSHDPLSPEKLKHLRERVELARALAGPSTRRMLSLSSDRAATIIALIDHLETINQFLTNHEIDIPEFTIRRKQA